MTKRTIPLKRRPRRHVVRRESDLSPAAKRAIIRVVVFVALVLCTLLAFFSIRPYMRDSRLRERLLNANRLYRDGKAETAIEQYRLIETEHPSSDIAREAAMRRRDIEPYVEAARAMKLDADAAFRRQEFEEALSIYKKAAEEFPLSLAGAAARASRLGCAKLACDRRDEKALAEEERKHWDEALIHYRRILEIVPDYPYAAEGLKAAEEKIAQFDETMKRAKATEQERRWSEAKSEYELALEILPDNAEAFEDRARVLAQIPPPPGMVLAHSSREFVVGSDDGQPDEKPQRTLRGYGFYIDTYEVTNAAYAEFVASTGRTPPPHWGGSQPPSDMAELPVVCVSWHDATAYAAWAGKRLPTEEEWERAARGADGRTYPWGEEFRGTEGVFASRSAPVGRVPMDCTQEGCFDMGGNVSEWTASGKPPPKPTTKRRVSVRPNRRTRRDARVPAEEEVQAEPPTGRKFIRGASWAGLETHRSSRIIPQKIADQTSDPVKTVIVDHPTVWGIEAFGLSDLEFSLRGAANGIPVIEIRKWFSSQDKYVSARLLIHPGQKIEGERDIRIAEGRNPRNFTVRYYTGCDLLRFDMPDDPAEMQIVYADSNGIRHSIKRLRPETVLPMTRKDPCNIDAGILKTLSGRTLADSARSSNRMSAPPEARFINCGFRCVRDP